MADDTWGYDGSWLVYIVSGGVRLMIPWDKISNSDVWATVDAGSCQEFPETAAGNQNTGTSSMLMYRNQGFVHQVCASNDPVIFVQVPSNNEWVLLGINKTYFFGSDDSILVPSISAFVARLQQETIRSSTMKDKLERIPVLLVQNRQQYGYSFLLTSLRKQQMQVQKHWGLAGNECAAGNDQVMLKGGCL